MTFAAGLILGGIVGSFGGFLLACILAQAKWGDQQLERSRPEFEPYDPDPLGISERMSRKARALERAGIVPLQGKTQVGKDPR